MNLKPLHVLPLILALLLIPVAARADAGTPLMYAGALHLLFLNFGIGILEGSVLARLFRLSKLNTQVSLIPANYLSAFVGWLLLSAAWVPLMRLWPGTPPLLKAGPLLVGLVLASFLLSVLLEWPFCAWAMRGAGHGWRGSLRGSLVAQTVSYALIVPFYLLASPITFLTIPHLQDTLSFVRSPSAAVFYISPRDGSVWRVLADGTQGAQVLDAHVSDPDARLFVRTNAVTHLCDIGVAQYDQGRGYNFAYRMLLRGVGTGCVPSWRGARGMEDDTSTDWGRPADLRPASGRAWRVESDYWAGRGLRVLHMRSPTSDDALDSYTLAFETPFAQWPCRNATVLPSDQVVFQLGRGADAQVAILDMRSRDLGVVAQGQGPVVVMEPTAKARQ